MRARIQAEIKPLSRSVPRWRYWRKGGWADVYYFTMNVIRPWGLLVSGFSDVSEGDSGVRQPELQVHGEQPFTPGSYHVYQEPSLLLELLELLLPQQHRLFGAF